MLIAYTLLRRLMRQMAEHAKVAPLRMGFHVAAIAIIDMLRFAPLESPATLPRRLALLFEQAPLLAIPERRCFNASHYTQLPPCVPIGAFS